MATAANTTAVEQLYSKILLRSGTEVASSDIESWATEIDSGALTLAQVASGFTNSTEAQSTVLPIARLYQAFFNRAPDADGLNAHVDAFRSGTLTLEQMAVNMRTADEFSALYGSNPSNETFVTALYQNVLGRLPDAEGLAAWTNAMNAGALNAANVALSFANSLEFKSYIDANIQTWLSDAGTTGTYGGTIGGGPIGVGNTDSGAYTVDSDGVKHWAYTLTTEADFLAITNPDTHGVFTITGGAEALASTTGDTIDLSNLQTLGIKSDSTVSLVTVALGAGDDVVTGAKTKGGYYLGDGNDTIISQDSVLDTIYAGAGVDTMTGGSYADHFMFTDVDADIDTTAGSVTDIITDFADDLLHFETAGEGAYAENLTAAANLSALLAAADAALNGSTKYYFGAVGTNGYLVYDDDGIGYTSVIQLTGVVDFDASHIYGSGA